MKIHQPLRCLAGAALVIAAATTTTHAQSWETVDDYQYSPDVTSTSGHIIASDPSGILLTVSSANTSAGTTQNVIRRSVDHGATWQTIGELSGYGLIKQIVFAPSGDAFSIGRISPSNLWRVSKSTDGGATWTLVDDFQGTNRPSAMDITVDPSGHLFVAGQTLDDGKWLVRRSTDGGSTWTTMGAFPTSGGIYSLKVAASSVAIVVVGSINPGGWLISRSADGGNTWTKVDNYYNYPDANWPNAATVDRNGNFYVAGRLYGGYSSIRRSTDSGLTWETVDYFGGPTEGSANLDAIAVDSMGRVFAVGVSTISPLTGGQPWTVRSSADGGNTWETIDTFYLGLGYGYGSYAGGVACDPSGNVFVKGHASRPELFGNFGIVGVTHSVIRKLAGAPQLSLAPANGQLRLVWPTNATGFVLQSATTLANGGDWQDSLLSAAETNGQNVVTMNPTAPAAFFRLRGP